MPWPKCRTGSNCAIPRAAIKDHVLRHLDAYLSSSKPPAPPPAGKCTGRATPTRPIGIDHRYHHERMAHTEVIKVKTMTSDETALNPALEAAGITPYRNRSGRPHHPARPRQAFPHRGARRCTATRPKSADLFMDKMKLQELGERAEDLAAAARALSARAVPARARGLQRRQLRHRRNRLPLRGGIGRQRPHVRHACPRS